MATAHDQWLEAPYQEAQEAADPVAHKLSSWDWLSTGMKIAADAAADELASVICDKQVWSDADALLMGRILMDTLREMAELEVRQ